MRELLVAPFNLRASFLEMIENETDNARAGKPAAITAKINSLIEEGVIEALYRASAAGVPVRLLVRGMCSLRPGVKGISENIEVRSIVGRFLEHSRIYRFENGGQPKICLGSADWMQRNLQRRVETVFPVVAPGMREHVEEILEWFWKDNVKARVLHPDGAYRPLQKNGHPPFDAQAEFLADAQRRRKARLAAAAAAAAE
jgi:polyphosphate kinase